MSYLDIKRNYEELKIFLRINRDTFYLNTPEKIILFPFKTREPDRAKFTKGFTNVTGEVVRNVLSIKNENLNDLVDFLKRTIKETKVREDFIHSFLELINSDVRKIQYPKALSLYSLTNDDSSNGEKEISRFINNTLLAKSSELRDFLNEDENKNNGIITKLLSMYLQSKNDIDINFSGNYYANTKIINQFRQDLALLMKDNSMFISYFDIFMNFYYFQLVHKNAIDICNLNTGESNKPLFYLLDWESASNNRDACKPTTSFAYMYESTKDIYTIMNVLEHLNILFGVEKKNFREISIIFQDSDNKTEIKQVLIDLIQLYAEKSKIDFVENATQDKHFDELYKIYIDTINEGLRKTPGASSRYHKSLIESCKYYFLKKRGTLGYVLNINHDFLMLMVYLAVNEKEKLNLIEMFEIFERRGIHLDKHSKEIAVEYLGKLNLIDKKSDSGAAQYVKSIL